MKPFPHTTNGYRCKLRKIIYKGGMDGENRSKMVICFTKNGETCDRNTHTPGLTWDRLLSFSFNTLHYFHPDKPSRYCLTCLKKRKRKKKENQHKPRRPPHCQNRHVSFRARRPFRLSLCSVCLFLYRASLPMMTPMTKKSTQSARMRVLRPSSLMGEVIMGEE